MGVMRFAVYPETLLEEWPELQRAYVSGFDGRVFPTRVEVEGNIIACRRTNADSGKVHVALPIPGFGRPTVSTSSLPEREAPFLLAVELARGRISQLRDQLAAWEMAGMAVPDEYWVLHKQAHHLFAEASAQQHEAEEASATAWRSLEVAFQAAKVLSESYTAQRLAVRRKRSGRLPASLGCNLGRTLLDEETTKKFCDAFTAVVIPIEWKHIEPTEGEYDWDIHDKQIAWAQEQKLMMTAGPLLDLSPEGLPPWLWQWEHDFLNLQSFVCDFVETAVARFAGLIRHWEVSARVNSGGALALSEENRLSLVARTLEVVRQVDDELKLTVRIDQPWGAYQARGQHRLSPLHFIDALIRSGVGLYGVNLEIGVGYSPRGTAPRDLLDFSRLIDLWSCLGVPLEVTLAFPSSTEPDPHATTDLEVETPEWKEGWTEAAQAAWVDAYLPMLMAKQVVVGIYWAHFSDAVPHHFPHAGLLRADGTPKPALENFIKYRQEYWQPDLELL
jgi:hypothetical protein